MLDRSKYPPLIYAPLNSAFQNGSTGLEVFDPIRKKYVLLTPEEWVRQHLIQYLKESLAYPAGRTEVERKVVYEQNHV